MTPTRRLQRLARRRSDDCLHGRMLQSPFSKLAKRRRRSAGVPSLLQHHSAPEIVDLTLEDDDDVGPAPGCSMGISGPSLLSTTNIPARINSAARSPPPISSGVHEQIREADNESGVIYPNVHPVPLQPFSRKRGRRTASRSSISLPLPQEVEPWTAGKVDDEVRRCLRKCSTKKKERYGLVYIQQVKGYKDLFKIGSTDRTATDRQKEIEYSCGFELEVKHRTTRCIDGFFKAEKLAQAELLPFREEIECPVHGKTHTEYFRLPLTDIKPVVTRWERFVERQPYTSSNELRPFWRDRLDKTSIPPEGEKREHHAQRGQRWNTFIDASIFDRLRYWLYNQDFHRVDSWLSLLLALSIISFLLIWWDTEFKGRMATFKVGVEVLRVLPLVVAAALKWMSDEGKPNRRRSST